MFAWTIIFNIHNTMKYPEYKDKKELYAWLVANKRAIMHKKKSAVKNGDGVPYMQLHQSEHKAAAEMEETTEDGVIERRLVINTTLLMDSHRDVHLNGIWTKTMKEKAYTILNREHVPSFDAIIAEGDDVKASVVKYTWKELGFPKFKGETEALVYDAVIRKDINESMYNRYLKNRVRNHSVEMMYTKITMAINDPDYKEEFAEWEKIFPLIANPKNAEEIGYFFPVYEAKHLGGAAVPKGSNIATPTRPAGKEETEPPYGTPDIYEPPYGTRENKLIYLI